VICIMIPCNGDMTVWLEVVLFFCGMVGLVLAHGKTIFVFRNGDSRFI
jgi:hypothetical protein